MLVPAMFSPIRASLDEGPFHKMEDHLCRRAVVAVTLQANIENGVARSGLPRCAMTEYFVYGDCFVRVAVQEVGPRQFIWEYQVDGGFVYQDTDRPLSYASTALELGFSAAQVHIDQIDRSVTAESDPT